MNDPNVPNIAPSSKAPRSPSGPLFHVVLHEPEIPNNTGNIGRTCVATHSALHLIHPLGFDISDKACRRAGLDYWPRLNLHEHATFDGFCASQPDIQNRLWVLTTRAERCLFDAEMTPGDLLLFGRESRGLPSSILEQYPDRCIGLPMAAGERSLNLASVVASVVFFGINQLYVRNKIGISAGNRLEA
jgi:tRNA (cytidine/uridine-2'-O-)-methyltransferase